MLATTDSPASSAIKFKINAKAATTQVAGDYKNVINFTVVANVPPKTIGEVLEDNPQVPRDPITNLPTIQAVTEEICGLAGVYDKFSTVTDIRDHHNYRVAKLRDDRCWMLDNLKLDLTMTNANSRITASNTNASVTALNALFDGGRNSGDNYAIAGVQDWTTAINSYSVPLINKQSQELTIGTMINPDDTFVGANDWKFGIYYNLCVTTAGSYCYGENDASAGTAINLSEDGVDAVYDICPAGWRLPTGDPTLTSGPSEVIGVLLAYSSDGELTRSILHLPTSGDFHDGAGAATAQGRYGHYWTSSYSNNTNFYAYHVAYSTPYFSLVDSLNCSGGRTIRCIVK